MTFSRTNSGLSNSSKFHRADVVIYTEGGDKSFSIEDVENGKFNEHSVDIKFWGNILSAHGFSRKIKFKALGSKTAARNIAERVAAGEISHTAVARDRDLDNIFSNDICSPLVFCTKGYSWENDVYSMDITRMQVQSMIMNCELDMELKRFIEENYREFFKLGKSLAKLEIIFRSQGVKFISDISADNLFASKKSCDINKERIYQLIIDKKKKIDRPINVYGVDAVCPHMDNFGKLVATFSYRLISFLCKKYHRSIPKSMIEASMLNIYSTSKYCSNDTYYSELVQRLDAAL